MGHRGPEDHPQTSAGGSKACAANHTLQILKTARYAAGELGPRIGSEGENPAWLRSTETGGTASKGGKPVHSTAGISKGGNGALASGSFSNSTQHGEGASSSAAHPEQHASSPWARDRSPSSKHKRMEDAPRGMNIPRHSSIQAAKNLRIAASSYNRHTEPSKE
jgi:hypothetical protein